MTSHKIPHDIEAERAILGYLIITENPDSVMYSLSTEDFYSDRNREVFRQILSLREAGKKIHPIEIARSEHCGGAAYVTSLLDGVPDSKEMAEQLSELLHEKSGLRDTIQILTEALTKTDGSERSEELTDWIISKLLDLESGRKAAQNDGVSYRDAAVSLVQSLESRTNHPIMTGLPSVDERTGGFLAGELVTVTAHTGVGKTIFAQQVCHHSCARGQHSIYFSAEMSGRQLEGRRIAARSGVPHYKIRRPEALQPDDWGALVKAASEECPDCKVVDGEITLSRIRWASRRGKASLVVVDYDELVSSPGATKLDQEISLVIGLKKLAIEIQCPVILISQLRKPASAEDRKAPLLSQIYGSGSKTKHASVVLYVDRKFVETLRGDETEAKICVLKSRDGKVGNVACRFVIHRMRFEEEATASSATLYHT